MRKYWCRNQRNGSFSDESPLSAVWNTFNIQITGHFFGSVKTFRYQAFRHLFIHRQFNVWFIKFTISIRFTFEISLSAVYRIENRKSVHLAKWSPFFQQAPLISCEAFKKRAVNGMHCNSIRLCKWITYFMVCNQIRAFVFRHVCPRYQLHKHPRSFARNQFSSVFHTFDELHYVTINRLHVIIFQIKLKTVQIT